MNCVAINRTSAKCLVRPAGTWCSGVLAGLVMVLGYLLGVGHAHALEAIPMAHPSFLDLQEDIANAKSYGKTLMVMFEQDGCVYCERLRRDNLSKESISSLIAEKFYLVQVDIWGERELVDYAGNSMKEKEFSRRQNVQLTPMILFYDDNGSVVHKMTGYYKPDRFLLALKYVADREYLRERFKDYALSSQRSGDVPKLSKHAINTDVTKSGHDDGGMLLLFEQSDCHDCVELNEDVIQDPKVISMLKGRYNVMSLDIWGDGKVSMGNGVVLNERELVQKYNINYTPTLLFLGGGGDELFRVESYREPKHLKLVIDYMTSGAYEQYPSFQDWLRHAHKVGDATAALR